MPLGANGTGQEHSRNKADELLKTAYLNTEDRATVATVRGAIFAKTDAAAIRYAVRHVARLVANPNGPRQLLAEILKTIDDLTMLTPADRRRLDLAAAKIREALDLREPVEAPLVMPP